MGPIEAHQIVDKATYLALDYRKADQVDRQKSDFAMIEIATSVLGVHRSVVKSISKPSSLNLPWVAVADTREESGDLFQ